MPALIRELSDEEAMIMMVNSNIQREELLFSEKAFAYKMRMDAMRKQGSHSDLISTQVGGKLESAEIVGQECGDSKNQVRRYVRLTELVPDLLEMVDAKRLPFNTAVEISYLSQAAQGTLLEYMTQHDRVPSMAQAQEMKRREKDGGLTYQEIDRILMGKKDPGVPCEGGICAVQICFEDDRAKSSRPTIQTVIEAGLRKTEQRYREKGGKSSLLFRLIKQ